jgi:hypothetical protein
MAASAAMIAGALAAVLAGELAAAIVALAWRRGRDG